MPAQHPNFPHGKGSKNTPKIPENTPKDDSRIFGGTLQPEIIAKWIPKALFHVTEMRFSKRTIPQTLGHVILWITNEYVICNLGEIIPEKDFL